MVLEDRHDRPSRGAERAVEGRGRLGAALATNPDVEAAGLELGAVGCRGELAILLLRRDPCLAVELAYRRGSEVAGRDVDDPERQLDHVGQPLLLVRQE